MLTAILSIQKPTKTDHSVEEVPGGYLLVRSASTGSISNAVLASTLGEELLANKAQDVHPTTTTTTTTRQPTKIVCMHVFKHMCMWSPSLFGPFVHG